MSRFSALTLSPARLTWPLRRLLSLSAVQVKSAAVVVGMLLVAALAGLGTYAMGTSALIYLGLILAGFWMLGLISAGRGEFYDVALGLMVIGLFVVPLAFKLFSISLLVQYQAFALAVSLGGIAALTREGRTNRWLGLSLLIFVVFVVLAVVTSFTGRSAFAGGLFQFISDLKPFLLVAVGYRLAWAALTEKAFWWMVRWYWLLAFALVAWEWLSPGSYVSVFPGSGLPSGDPSGLLPSRAMATFEHPSFLANLAVILSLLCFARARECPQERRLYGVLTVLNLLLLVATASRGEQFGMLVAGGAGVMLMNRRLSWLRIAAASLALAAIGLLFWLAFADSILDEMGNWGIGTYGPISQPRAQVLQGALMVAERYFPLGSGLGTYGGAGAEKFDLSLYYDLGFGNYWWFRREDYLMDTYWPNTIAETGFIGSLLLLASYLLLALHALLRGRRSASPRARIHWFLAFTGMIYLLANSPGSPVFQDPRLFLLIAVSFGIATRIEQRDASTHAAESDAHA